MTHRSQAIEIVVVRHGETDWNAKGRYQGHTQNDLNSEGGRQARALAARFAADAAVYDGIIASDLRRALHTAEIIAERTGLSLITDKRLRERKVGIFRGFTQAETRERFPKEYAAFNADACYVVPEGESKQELQDHAVEFLADIATSRAGKRLIVVTHGGIIDSMLRHIFAVPLSMHLPFSNFNAGYNRLILRDGHWVVATLGDISHLAEIARTHAVREEMPE